MTCKNESETSVHAPCRAMHCGMCVRPHRPPPSSSDEKDPSPSEDEQMRASATDEPDGSEHAGAYGSDSASNAGGGGSESGTRVSVLGNDMTEEACERRYGCRQTQPTASPAVHTVPWPVGRIHNGHGTAAARRRLYIGDRTDREVLRGTRSTLISVLCWRMQRGGGECAPRVLPRPAATHARAPAAHQAT